MDLTVPPAMLSRAAQGDERGGHRQYDPDSSAAGVRTRRGPLLELLVEWAGTVL